MPTRTGAEFERTPEETADPELFWRRDDQAFFAAGACHILAFAFRDRYPSWTLIYLEPFGNEPGQHVYATDGHGYAFDHNGVTAESDLLGIINETYTTLYPGWRYSRLVINTTLEEFCELYAHWFPDQFAGDVWTRAHRYIDVLMVEHQP